MDMTKICSNNKRRAGRTRLSKNESKSIGNPPPPKPKTIRELVFDTICESENGITPKQIQMIIKRQPRRIREHTSTLKVEGKITEEHCRCGSNIPIYRKA